MGSFLEQIFLATPVLAGACPLVEILASVALRSLAR
jgi:hypothetical protein